MGLTITPAGGAAHSGGVIGTLTFEGTGSVGFIVSTGVIDTVTYADTGIYDVTFDSVQPDTGYLAIPSGYSTSGITCIVDEASKTTSGFTIKGVRQSDSAARDLDNVQVAVMRLSQ